MLARSIAYDPAFNALSIEAQLLFLRAIPHLDRDGLCVGEPVALWGHIAPRCPALLERMEPAIEEWAAGGLVERYDSDLGPVLWFTGFSRNQQGMNYAREGASIYPPPSGHIRTARGLQRVEDAVVYECDKPLPDALKSPSGAAQEEVGRDSGVNQEGVKPEPLAKQFARLLDELRESPNKAGKLGEIYTLCYGETPNFARLGKLAKEGGAGRLAQQLWQLSADRPAGDVLDYITKANAARRKAANGANGRDGNGTGHNEQEPDAEFLQSFRAAQGRSGSG